MDTLPSLSRPTPRLYAAFRGARNKVGLLSSPGHATLPHEEAPHYPTMCLQDSSGVMFLQGMPVSALVERHTPCGSRGPKTSTLRVHRMVRPPSTGRTMPVMNEASSDMQGTP